MERTKFPSFERRLVWQVDRFYLYHVPWEKEEGVFIAHLEKKNEDDILRDIIVLDGIVEGRLFAMLKVY